MLTSRQEENTPSIVTADPVFESDLFQEQIREQLKIPETVPVAKVVDQLVGHFVSVTPENHEKINFLLAHVMAHNPASLLEAQLVAQMLISHKLYTKMLVRSEKEVWAEAAEKWTNSAVKLARAFRAGMETLSKVRRNGEQRITIERVNIQKDGNAIIGNVSSSRGAADYGD